MHVKFIQVNIEKGSHLDALLKFLKKENPDFVSVQEITSGGVNLCGDKNLDLFQHIKRVLNMKGEVHRDFTVTTVPEGFYGNAIITKHKIRKHNVVVLRDPVTKTELEANDERFFPYIPRHLLDVFVEVGSYLVHVMSWHGAWTAPPTDTEETLRQSRLVRDYLVELNEKNEPYLLGGDLNSTPDKKTVRMISEVTNNLMIDSGVKQTTHPKIHKIAPLGFLIDYIFTSKHFKLIKLEVPEIVVSDHLPVIAELEFK